MFPRGIGDLLAVEFPELGFQCPKKIHLMGREWPATTETVSLTLDPFDDLDWDAEVDFVFEEGLPFALLGYEGFLNRWAVSFHGHGGYFIVEPADGFDERQPAEVIDGLRQRWPELFAS
ncbi:MAG: hypothetical protein M0Z30_05680 [Actinomycetota bacterium]|nr:hypothetical protein [Actinomycetota bacterium]